MVTVKGWALPSDVAVYGLRPEIRNSKFTVGNYFFNIKQHVRPMEDLVVDIPDELFDRYRVEKTPTPDC